MRYRDKVHRCLDALERMLADGSFCFPHKHIGLELELNLVDSALRPAMSNDHVLEYLGGNTFSCELGKHNLELNVLPRPLAGDSLGALERDLHGYLTSASEAAENICGGMVVIGILPTLTDEQFSTHWMSGNPRYQLLNNEIIAARRELPRLEIDGTALPGRSAERLHTHTETILPESAGTAAQFHLQVGPEDFAPYWNAAQCLAGVQLALGANSPFLLGKALWHETRIPLFLQSTDTRPEEFRAQGVRPRVWFGERWITSIFDLFEENVRYFPGLLTETDPEDPLETLEAGRVPQLTELRTHNGTVWRWNRPVYDVVDGTPHLRIENRVLPAGPTVLDMLANAAFFYGAQRALADAERPLWSQMSFDAAEQNLFAGARDGIHARLYWPGTGSVPADELALRVLLPLAHEGLLASGVPTEAADHYLDVLERRCVARRTGSSWQRDAVLRLESRGMNREAALEVMLAEYVDRASDGRPVHEWDPV
ncbi:glutamate--cysteine ligase [Haloechinothrix sp. LS1_15]|uniref:glutamate--cysteine ligase n=1 Tax=Haloechinothrix sp. LS1_15 TaxID=2652248 RepID=UPI002947805A|nr:glutamate--cysteine ligase [Haloechinothrix sp. LS1_15]MDV6014365.1 glutamate--cysteine ligase [Haloechinothrix sp. LS1_15]